MKLERIYHTCRSDARRLTTPEGRSRGLIKEMSDLYYLGSSKCHTLRTCSKISPVPLTHSAHSVRQVLTAYRCKSSLRVKVKLSNVNVSPVPKNARSSGRHSFFVDRPDIARREVAQTESTPVVVDAVVEADARRTLLECGVGALEDLYAIFVNGEGIADSSEFEYVAVDAGSSVPHDISEIVQGPVPADEGEVWLGRDDRAVQFVAGDGVPGDGRAYAEFHFFAAGPAVNAGNFDGCLYLLVLRPCTLENCGRIGI